MSAKVVIIQLHVDTFSTAIITGTIYASRLSLRIFMFVDILIRFTKKKVLFLPIDPITDI